MLPAALLVGAAAWAPHRVAPAPSQPHQCHSTARTAPGLVRMVEQPVAFRGFRRRAYEALAPLDHLLLAQPRALSPAENVALDEWVRAGGRLLLFADPMLTSHSQFAIGDPRRPQDVALLSPILARWGLELTFDTTQPQGERIEEAFEMAIPVDLAGAWVPFASEAPGECAIVASGIAARCRIGKGQVFLLADAALLDGEEDPDPSRRRAMLDGLLDQSLLR